MSERLKKILAANTTYSENNKAIGDLKPYPVKEIAILTCMDVRLDPLRFAGLDLGDANIIRNAGGRASEDAIRSLVVSYKLLGSKEFFVIMHTECGMETIDNKTIASLLSGSFTKAEFDGKQWRNVDSGKGSEEGYKIDWLTFKGLEETVISDVNKIRNHPLVPQHIKINGLIYDVQRGSLREVVSM